MGGKSKRDFIHFRALDLRRRLEGIQDTMIKRGQKASLSFVARSVMHKGLDGDMIEAELLEVHANVTQVTQRALNRLCREMAPRFGEYLREELDRFHQKP